jgi:NAD(P)H dehydrogenase (quinone)
LIGLACVCVRADPYAPFQLENSMTTIALTGASGNLGRVTLQFLAKRGVPFADTVLIARDVAKVKDLASQGYQVRQGDYTDLPSLEKAFRGIDKLLFISTSALGEERMRQHRNVVAAARAASVGHIVYTSIIKPAPTAVFAATPGHFQTEALIHESGIAHSFFRNNLYMELIPLVFGGALQSGVLMSCAGEGRVGFVARTDIAEALAAVLASTAPLKSSYDVTTSREAYGLADVAAALGTAKGTKVTYVRASAERFRRTLTGFGLPAEVVELSVALGEAMRLGEFDASSSDLATLLGRAPTDLQTFLHASDENSAGRNA